MEKLIMSNILDPNPPARREEEFPKTTTIPEGWVTDALMESYNHTGPVEGDAADNGTRPTTEVDESLFTRRLDPFPKPNTIPNGWDLSGM
jgi:hypothetical protein